MRRSLIGQFLDLSRISWEIKRYRRLKEKLKIQGIWTTKLIDDYEEKYKLEVNT